MKTKVLLSLFRGILITLSASCESSFQRMRLSHSSFDMYSIRGHSFVGRARAYADAQHIRTHTVKIIKKPRLGC
jgi:hypothetical protein